MRFTQIRFLTRDLAALHSFYCRTLGLRELVTAESRSGRLDLLAGETVLIFEQAPEAWSGNYHFAFNIPANQFEAAQKWLMHRAPALSDKAGNTSFHHSDWNADSVYFLDPGGNILELIARHNLKTNALDQKPHFDANRILSVSEIGLAVDDVEGAVANLITQIPGTAVYGSGEPDMFSAVGDENGLLIIVRQGRIWYPDSGIPALHLPVDIRLTLENGGSYRITAPPFPFVINPHN